MAIAEDTVLAILSDNESLTDLVGDRIFNDPPPSKSPPRLPWLHFDCEIDKDKSPSPQTGTNERDAYDVVVDIWSKTHLEFSEVVRIFREELDNTNSIRFKRSVVDTTPENPLDYRGSVNFTIWA